MIEVSASRFKAQCLALLDDVAEGSELVVTKRGRPVARVVPFEDDVSLRGSVTYNVNDEELLAPIEAEWEAAPPSSRS
jgi:prevent-host-death family protein